MSIYMQIFACFIATIFFSFLLNQPPKTMIFSGFIGTAGYIVFVMLGQTTMGYFFGTLCIAIFCEIAARLLKKTATLFLVSALIPIVPGVGLYRTMRYLVENNLSQAAKVGSDTLLGICAIALAITFCSVIFSNIHRKNRGAQA